MAHTALPPWTPEQLQGTEMVVITGTMGSGKTACLAALARAMRSRHLACVGDGAATEAVCSRVNVRIIRDAEGLPELPGEPTFFCWDDAPSTTLARQAQVAGMFYNHRHLRAGLAVTVAYHPFPPRLRDCVDVAMLLPSSSVSVVEGWRRAWVPWMSESDMMAACAAAKAAAAEKEIPCLVALCHDSPQGARGLACWCIQDPRGVVAAYKAEAKRQEAMEARVAARARAAAREKRAQEVTQFIRSFPKGKRQKLAQQAR